VVVPVASIRIMKESLVVAGILNLHHFPISIVTPRGDYVQEDKVVHGKAQKRMRRQRSSERPAKKNNHNNGTHHNNNNGADFQFLSSPFSPAHSNTNQQLF
jgi:hypothetical protein